MPVQGVDLLEPNGPVAVSFFPEDGDTATVTARLDSYLDDGYQRVQEWTTNNTGAVVDADRAAEAWALHRVYTAIHLRLASSPANASLSDQGSRSYLVDQIKAFADKAKQYLAEYTAILEMGRPGIEEAVPHGSNYVKNRFVW